MRSVPVNQALPQDVTDALSQQYACYVLITCEEPGADGQMQVQLSYEGDEALASLLIDGAQSIMEGQQE